MPPQIVSVNVTQTVAPPPDSLQQTGAFISQGATITAPGTSSLLTELSDLTDLLAGSQTLASLSWTSSVVTAVATAPHEFTIGDTLELTIAGVTPSGYNGVHLCNITGASTFTFILPINPGAETVPGVYTVEDVSELLAMATTFFAQGSQTAVTVFECGAGSASDGVAYLSAYITANPNAFYAYLVPRYWDGNADFLSMLASFESTTAKTYFFVTTKLNTYTKYLTQMKDVVALIESPQMDAYPANRLTAISWGGDSIAVSATVATSQSGSSSYVPGTSVLSLVGVAGTSPTFSVTDTELASDPVINAVGSGGTPGLTTFTGSTGVGTKFTFTGTINDYVVSAAAVNAGGTGGTPGLTTFTVVGGTGTPTTLSGTIGGGGVLSGSLTVVDPGDYTASPGATAVAITGGSLSGGTVDLTFTAASGNLTGQILTKVTGGDYTTNPSLTAAPFTGGSLSGGTAAVKMGVLTAVLATPGAVGSFPANPIDTTATGGGTGATLNVTWDVAEPGGVMTATTTTSHGVAVGDWFQLQGSVPVGYNGWFQAIAGTTGSTLVAGLEVNPGAETTLGTLEGSQTVNAGIPALEFSLAFPFRVALHYLPSSTNKVAPFAFQYGFGVTPFPLKGMSATLATLKNAAINYVLTGAEGGITNFILEWGTTRDDRDFTYWYSVDWAQINSARNLANVIINGSNNPVNPLYYSQDGINRLQDAVVATMFTAISVGLANGTVARSNLDGPAFVNAIEAGQFDGKIVVNAIPFVPYLRVNPGDYRIGRYAGLSVQYIPNRGFISILLNINVTDFVAP